MWKYLKKDLLFNEEIFWRTNTSLTQPKYSIASTSFSINFVNMVTYQALKVMYKKYEFRSSHTSKAREIYYQTSTKLSWFKKCYLYLWMQNFESIRDIEGAERGTWLLTHGLPVNVSSWAHTQHVHYAVLVYECYVANLLTLNNCCFWSSSNILLSEAKLWIYC